MNNNCNYCIAPTKDGGVCTRKAACAIKPHGCKLFCWQHAQTYGGKYNKKVGCIPPKLPKCKCSNVFQAKSQKIPCKKKLTVFNNKQDLNDYCNLVKERKKNIEYNKKDRGIIAMLATDEIKIQKRKSILKRNIVQNNIKKRVSFKL